MSRLPPHLPQRPTEPAEIYPTMGSLQEVLDLAESQLPIRTRNHVTTLLMTYHNTLLSQIARAIEST